MQFGLREGPRNQHPGQGTANRRFPFANAMIELLWVSDSREAQSPRTRRTLLWERWAGREISACPFGICLRPGDPQDTTLPFPGWEYRPTYLTDPLYMLIGEASVEEPMWIYLSFQQKDHYKQRFVDHSNGIQEITGLTLTTRASLRSEASQKVMESGVLIAETGSAPLLEVEFDGRRRKSRTDFRPLLPLVFQW